MRLQTVVAHVDVGIVAEIRVVGRRVDATGRAVARAAARREEEAAGGAREERDTLGAREAAARREPVADIGAGAARDGVVTTTLEEELVLYDMEGLALGASTLKKFIGQLKGVSIKR